MYEDKDEAQRVQSIGYEAPAIEESAHFETVVAACGYGPNDRSVPACRADNSRGGGMN